MKDGWSNSTGAHSPPGQPTGTEALPRQSVVTEFFPEAAVVIPSPSQWEPSSFLIHFKNDLSALSVWKCMEFYARDTELFASLQTFLGIHGISNTCSSYRHLTGPAGDWDGSMESRQLAHLPSASFCCRPDVTFAVSWAVMEGVAT